MKKIKVAQIGTGHDHATASWQTINRLTDIFEVVGYAFPENDTEQYERTKAAYEGGKLLDMEELLAMRDLDAVLIETNELESTRFAQLAADRGWHVQLDKPGGESAEEFETLCRTLKSRGLVLNMGYMYRYNPEVLRLYERIGRGELGEILSVETHMDCEHPTWKRAWLGQFRGGMMFFLGCHLLDLIYRIRGMPTEIINLNSASRMEGTTSLDQGFCVLRYPNGMSFAHTFADEPAGFMRRQLVVTGTKGTAVLQPLEAYTENGLQITGVREATPGKGWCYDGERRTSEPFDRYEAMIKAFASFIRGEAVNPYTYEYECTLHRIVLAASGIDVDYHAPITL